MTRVLIVDDSALFRTLLKAGLERDAEIQVIGQASSGEEAITLVASLKPDVVTMDVVMPGIDGFETVRQIMAQQPTPILVISNLDREKVVFRMLAAGALDVIPKPRATVEAMIPIAEKVKSLDKARPRFSRPLAERGTAPVALKTTPAPSRPTARRATPSLPEQECSGQMTVHSGPVVFLVSSAGGPQALAHILADLPAQLPAALLVVQHIAAGFGRGLANWLNSLCPLSVRLAEDNQPLQNGLVLVAPDNAHLFLTCERRTRLDTLTEPIGALRPAADLSLRSVAEVCEKDLLAVVLTGMGSDGAEGVKAVKAHGGHVAVQDQASSAVYGMPKAARPFADRELALEEIASYIVHFAHERRVR